MSNCEAENKFNLIFLLIGVALLCLSSGLEAGALFKWIDDDGQVRYSDRLPPDRSKQKHQQLNSQGVVLSTREAAKTDEQLAAEAEAKRIEEQRLAEEAKIKDAQDKKDKVLLLTFSSEYELTQVRDDRLEVVDSVIRLINKSLQSNMDKLLPLQSIAEENYTSKGIEIPGGMAQKIEHFTRNILSRNAQLLLKLQEREKINQQYELDVARFRDLKSQ